MNYRKLVKEFLSQKSNSKNTQVAVALVAGLAAGAVISILFAPSKGSTIRNQIADKAKSLKNGMLDSYAASRDKIFGNHISESEIAENEVPHFTHHVAKKRKSDIKTLVNEAHQEQSLN